MLCAICKLRKAKRDCPGVGGTICTTCCGTEREQSVDCPLHCEYLLQAHEYEAREEEPANVPNLDIELPESFVEENEFLILLFTAPIAKVVAQEPSITDYDMREAFEALVKTWRTLQSGILFEHVPANPYAAMVCDAVRAELESLRERAAKADPDATITDMQVLGVFLFLQRLEYSWNNGRRKSRAFLDVVTRPLRAAEPEEETLVEPDEPLIIL